MKLFYFVKLPLIQSHFFKWIIVLFLLLIEQPIQSQVIPDNTLPENTRVTSRENRFKIEGGTTAGGNLFHSFSEFSIPTNYEAFFNNSETIHNIISRVTGGNISTIDGLIRANGTANLFLLNPNGILFAPNASLNLGGSFIGTTADSIVFADKSEFSAKASETIPVLTVSIPIGLQFRENRGTIKVQDTGHQLFIVGNTLNELLTSPIEGRQLTSGLKVNAGNTIILVGGNIVLEGGILTAEQGRIELGSVNSGLVNLSIANQEWVLGYNSVNKFGEIQLSNQALVDVSGLGTGSIQIVGAQIFLTDGSVVYKEHQGNDDRGIVEVKATELLELRGTTSNGQIPSQISIITKGSNSTGNISVSTEKLILQGGGRIITVVEPTAEGKGGNINVKAFKSLTIIGSSPIIPFYNSQIGTLSNSYTVGKAGNTTILTGQLTLLDGANIASITNNGNGAAGDIRVETTESIEIIGKNQNTFASSIVAASLSGGNAGNINITTPRLSLRDGGSVDTSAFGEGSAGNITINVSQLLEIRGKATGNDISEINSSTLFDSGDRSQLLGVFINPPEVTRQSGNIIINTNRLIIAQKAQITARNDLLGNAGNIQINANTIVLDNQSTITATTTSREGGNIILNVQDNLQLRRNSLISATALRTGNGGNIFINVDGFLTALENSDITANSQSATGGNIHIQANGILGIQGRREQTRQSDITATGVIQGFIELNTLEIDPTYGLTELPAQVIDPSTLVAQNPCQKGTESEFTITGRGGLPSTPKETLTQSVTAVELVEPTTTMNTTKTPKSQDISSPQPPIEPAQGWVFNEQGEVVLVAHKPSVPGSQRLPQPPATCPAP